MLSHVAVLLSRILSRGKRCYLRQDFWDEWNAAQLGPSPQKALERWRGQVVTWVGERNQLRGATRFLGSSDSGP